MEGGGGGWGREQMLITCFACSGRRLVGGGANVGGLSLREGGREVREESRRGSIGACIWWLVVGGEPLSAMCNEKVFVVVESLFGSVYSGWLIIEYVFLCQ